MSRIALGTALAVSLSMVMAGGALADDLNRWQAWATPKDGQSNAVDVSMLTADGSCGKKPFVHLEPRYRNRYQERVAGHLTVEHIDLDGTGKVDTTEFDLAPGETKIMTVAAFCHDSRQSLKFTIADLRFPDRDAEKAKLDAQKAAAEKAAAEEAARKKAEKDKAAADQAAAEAAQREKAKAEAERLAKQGEAEREEAAKHRKAGEHEAEESRVAQAEGQEYREKRQAEAQSEANRDVPVDDLAIEQFRNGEVSLGAPLGFESTDYADGSEGRFAYGLRAEVRVFKWISRLSERGQPLSGSGFEVTVNRSYGATNDLGGSSTKSTTRLSVAHMHIRYWHGALAVGIAGEWTRHSHTPDGGMTETSDLYALAPELAFGIVASRSLALEASVRAGWVASGNGLTLDTSKDLFAGASVIAELNRLYGGAFATRYVTSGSIDTWNALAVIGVRLPF